MKALRPPMALTNERRGVRTVNNKTFSLGDVIFRQQDPSDLVYEICRGRVGIFLDYETENQKMIADLSDGQFFGEMGVIEGSPRSATAVSLADGTLLRPVTEDELPAFLRENPDRLLTLMRQLSARTRERTLQYHEVCRALSAAVAAHKQGAEKDPALKQELEHISQAAEKPAKKKSYNPAVNTALFRYVLDDLEKTEGNRELVRVGFLERRRVRHLSPRELHVNPDDEFTDPNIGPSDRIISEYMDLIRNLQFQRADIFDEPVLVNRMKAGDVLFVSPDRFETEPPPHAPFDLIFKERLRKGTVDLIHTLQNEGFEVWVYTSSFRSERYLRALFSRYRIRFDEIVNAQRHLREVQRDRPQILPQKMPGFYRISLHVDDEDVIHENGRRYGFRTIRVREPDEHWAEKVLNEAIRIRNLEEKTR